MRDFLVFSDGWCCGFARQAASGVIGQVGQGGMFQPRLEVKIAAWRDGSASSKAADAAFAQAKRQLLTKRIGPSGQLVCEGCGAVTLAGSGNGLTEQGWFDVHHQNGNHADQSESNLSISCPFCHMPFHLGFHAMRGNGMVVFAPELSQRSISRVCWISLIGMYLNNDLASKAKDIYQALVVRGNRLSQWFGEGFTLDLANALHNCGKSAEEVNASDAKHADLSEDCKKLLERMKRADGFSALRFLPDIESEEIAQSAAYWQQIYKKEPWPEFSPNIKDIF